MKKQALLLLALLFSVSALHADDICEYLIGKPTNMALTVDVNNTIITGLLFYENGERTPIPNATIFITKNNLSLGWGQPDFICKMVTNTEGKVEYEFDPNLTGCVKYDFTFCSIVKDPPESTNKTLLAGCLQIVDPANTSNYLTSINYTDVPSCSGYVPTPFTPPKPCDYASSKARTEHCTPAVFSMSAELCWPLAIILGLMAGGMFLLGRNPLQAFSFAAPRMKRGKAIQLGRKGLSFQAEAVAGLAARGIGKTEYETKDGKIMKDKNGKPIVKGTFQRDSKGNLKRDPKTGAPLLNPLRGLDKFKHGNPIGDFFGKIPVLSVISTGIGGASLKTLVGKEGGTTLGGAIGGGTRWGVSHVRMVITAIPGVRPVAGGIGLAGRGGKALGKEAVALGKRAVASVTPRMFKKEGGAPTREGGGVVGGKKAAAGGPEGPKGPATLVQMTAGGTPIFTSAGGDVGPILWLPVGMIRLISREIHHDEKGIMEAKAALGLPSGFGDNEFTAGFCMGQCYNRLTGQLLGAIGQSAILSPLATLWGDVWFESTHVSDRDMKTILGMTDMDLHHGRMPSLQKNNGGYDLYSASGVVLKSDLRLEDVSIFANACDRLAKYYSNIIPGLNLDLFQAEKDVKKPLNEFFNKKVSSLLTEDERKTINELMTSGKFNEAIGGMQEALTGNADLLKELDKTVEGYAITYDKLDAANRALYALNSTMPYLEESMKRVQEAMRRHESTEVINKIWSAAVYTMQPMIQASSAADLCLGLGVVAASNEAKKYDKMTPNERETELANISLKHQDATSAFIKANNELSEVTKLPPEEQEKRTNELVNTINSSQKEMAKYSSEASIFTATEIRAAIKEKDLIYNHIMRDTWNSLMGSAEVAAYGVQGIHEVYGKTPDTPPSESAFKEGQDKLLGDMMTKTLKTNEAVYDKFATVTVTAKGATDATDAAAALHTINDNMGAVGGVLQGVVGGGVAYLQALEKDEKVHRNRLDNSDDAKRGFSLSASQAIVLGGRLMDNPMGELRDENGKLKGDFSVLCSVSNTTGTEQKLDEKLVGSSKYKEQWNNANKLFDRNRDLVTAYLTEKAPKDEVLNNIEKNSKDTESLLKEEPKKKK